MDRRSLAAWVGNRILPHESGVRAWLRRASVSNSDIDDLVQEAYCKLSRLETVAHITNPRAYFYQVVRNLRLEQIRRSRVVDIDILTDVHAATISSDQPLQDIEIGSKQQLLRVQRLIDELPERCRQVFTLRKVYGVSQREIARKLGISETIVENDVVKGLRLIMQRVQEEDVRLCRILETKGEHERKRRHD